MDREVKNVYRISVGKLQGKGSLQRPMCRHERHFKIYVKETRCEWVN